MLAYSRIALWESRTALCYPFKGSGVPAASSQPPLLVALHLAAPLKTAHHLPQEEGRDDEQRRDHDLEMGATTRS